MLSSTNMACPPIRTRCGQDPKRAAKVPVFFNEATGEDDAFRARIGPKRLADFSSKIASATGRFREIAHRAV
jgi:hypothetical protein